MGMLDSIPEAVKEAMAVLARPGWRVWLVGGAPRDSLLGLEPRDWDIATDCPASEVTKLFKRVIPIGIRHGTVKVLVGRRGMEIEVTSVPGQGDPGILADLARRDFTANAVAISWPGGEIIDPHHGIRDMDSRILRAVGDPRKRFGEDPLRIVRAARFVSTHGFTIEETTFQTIDGFSTALTRVAAERIRTEVFELLGGESVAEALRVLITTGIMKQILPELQCSAGKACHGLSRCEQTVLAVGLSPPRLRVRLAALFHVIGVGAAENGEGRLPGDAGAESSAAKSVEVMTRWKSSKRQIDEVSQIVRGQLVQGCDGWSEPECRAYIARVGSERLKDIIDLAYAARRAAGLSVMEVEVFKNRAKELIRAGFPLNVRDLAISGEDVQTLLGIESGPEIGKILRLVHREVLKNPAMNDVNHIAAFLRKEYHK